MNDTVKNHNQYQNFKFVTEKANGFGYPKERDVTYISAGWNFMILFAVMIMVVIGRYFSSQKAFSIKTPFQRAPASGEHSLHRERSQCGLRSS